VAKVFTTSNERTRFFSNIDFWVQALSLFTQLFVFGRVFKWVGLRVMLAAVPLLMTAGYVLYALIPTFAVLVPSSPSAVSANMQSRVPAATRSSPWSRGKRSTKRRA